MNKTKRRFMRHNKNQGFSLIELILVLGLSSLIFLGVLSLEKRRTETLRAEAAGQQVEEVGKALSNYIMNQKAVLTSNIPNGTTINLPLSLLQGVGSGPFVGKQYLPTTFNTTNAFGTGYVIQLRNNGGDSLMGLVTTDAPVVDETGAVRYDWLGYAARVAGAQSGMSFFSPTQVTGLNAGWALGSADFSAINAAGLLAYRSQYQGNLDDIYLRRDGLYPMTGNLNMGNHNIRDATDINFYGYLNGNNALLNNLQTGYIYNTGNIQNNGTITTLKVQGYGMSGPSNPSHNVNNNAGASGLDTSEFTRYIARHDVQTPYINRGGGDVRIGTGNSGNLYVKDIFLGDGSDVKSDGTVAAGQIRGWLSERLPSYVSKGIVAGNTASPGGNIVPKPNCGTGGTAKIEVIPQSVWVQGRVYNFPTLSSTANGDGTYNLSLNYDSNPHSVGGFDGYAIDGASQWTVVITTPNYNGDISRVNGRYIAHRYCHYTNTGRAGAGPGYN